MGSQHHYEKQAPDKKRDWIVKHKDEFPNRLRSTIEAARGLSSTSSLSSSQKFLSFIRLDLEKWVFASNGTEGLNDTIDTEEQVELALRCFPEVLTSRRLGLYPIFWLARSIHSVSFIPLFAQLGEELALFQDFERGGLVFGGNYLTVFSQLAAGTTDARLQHHRYYRYEPTANANANATDDKDKDDHFLVDERFLSVLKRLRESKLMKRKDIQTNDLLGTLHQQVVFPELRFRYLVDWDPRNTLLKSNGTALSWDLVSKCILDSEALSRCAHRESRDTAGIEMLFELAVTYFPLETGFLFHQYDVKRKRHQRGAMDDANFHKRRCRKYTLSRGSSPPREEHRTPPASTSSSSSSSSNSSTSTTVAAATTSKKATKKTVMPATITITKTMTPYRIACEKFGIERANAILRDALDRNAAGISDHCSSALVYAASEPRVDLDCVYILLQRNPAFCKVQ
eukprot:CAMPEP_0172385486 /NCGR_PEP_ID=MMETSP1061-20121228/3159_1 /TAXON_ID=37318 /ORGANISM="Pseudo-nitzschia pungens, Strain cf. pungens" /LENGTH=455 /DNA_ID=CAMNT_0013114539 /DNA_START=68 /DNA_END=1435 /DNA_ORIENTATION=+